ncbi:unnamed protein product [Diamesa hyperborea]
MKYMNSYRLESKNPFNREEVEKILQNVMKKELKKYEKFEKFDNKTSLALSRTMSEEVLTQIKSKNYDRYKIIVVITIGERFLQGLCIQSKNLWDPTRDFSVSFIEDNPRYFAIGNCYGIYLE